MVSIEAPVGKALIRRNKQAAFFLGVFPELFVVDSFAFGSAKVPHVVAGFAECPDRHGRDVLID